MYAFITFLFLLVTPYLGSPVWEEREIATDILGYSLPFSYDALEMNLNNPNNEISKRSLQILNSGHSWYRNCLSDYKRWQFAIELIYTDYKDIEGLPWLPNDLQKKVDEDIKLIKTIRAISKTLVKQQWFYYKDESGINDIRFYIRGLGIPSFDYYGEADGRLKKWEENKNNWNKK